MRRNPRWATNHPPDEAALREALYTWCGRQERAPAQVRRWLQDRGLPPHAIDQWLHEVEDMDLVNAPRFAHLFAGGKHRQNQWGRHKIAHGLRELGLPQNLIDHALAEAIDPQAYAQTLAHLLAQKHRSWCAQHPDEDPQGLAAKAALWRYAQQKGYEPDAILAAWHQLPPPG